MREAKNGEDVLELIGRRIGIHPRAISGEEEAALIYTAALHSMHLEGRRTLVVDIGGGSVELVVGKGASIVHKTSLKLGVLRLTQEFFRTDPISARAERKLEEHIANVLEPIAAKIERAGVERVVGTSGTILALGRATLSALSAGTRPDTLHHATVRADDLRLLRKKLVAFDLRRRMKVPGMDRRRADILPAGAVVLDAILARLQAREILLCEWALREGILLDFAARQRTALARAEAYPDVRRRSVLLLAERCQADADHARHVARLALEAFDATRARHRLGTEERDLLEYAALLHDVGHHISHTQHHKHSYYLVKNGDLRGFDPLEIEIMANVARYHRGGMPSKKHAGFGGLSRDARGRVLILAGLLRLAEALDRSHHQRVQNVKRAPGSRGVKLGCGSPAMPSSSCGARPVTPTCWPTPWAARSSSWRSPNAAPRAAPWRESRDGVRLKLMTEAAEAGATFETVAVVDMGSTSIRLVVAEIGADRTIRFLEEASRGVQLGKDAFTSDASAFPPWKQPSTRWTASAASWTATVSRASAPSRRPPCARPVTATPSSTACGCAPASRWR